VLVPTNKSGNFASFSNTDGYVELSREDSEFPAGIILPLHLWESPEFSQPSDVNRAQASLCDYGFRL
jgi:hypothetical protein